MNLYDNLSIDGIPVMEYFKNKPIDYNEYIQFVSLEIAKKWKWIDQEHINKYPSSEVALVSTLGRFNPYFNSSNYLISGGYKILDYIPGTGACAIIIQK